MRNYFFKFSGCVLFLSIFFIFSGVSLAGDQDRTDPSGGWNSQLGVLSLILTGDDLYLSYSAVFGAGAHICNASGIARYVAPGKYHLTDDFGTVALVVESDGVKMELIHGEASFCGAGWAGDTFSRDGYHPLSECKVTVPKTYFYDSPAQKRKAFVIQGDSVQTAPTRHLEGEGWVLARFTGKKGTTGGLVKTDDLECLE